MKAVFEEQVSKITWADRISVLPVLETGLSSTYAHSRICIDSRRRNYEGRQVPHDVMDEGVVRCRIGENIHVSGSAETVSYQRS